METVMKPGSAHHTAATDPFHYWRSMGEAYWEQWAKEVAAATHSEANNKLLTMLINSYLVATAPWQKVQEKLLTHLWQQCHLPTPADINRLANRLTRLEHKIDLIDAKLTDANNKVVLPKSARKARKSNPVTKA
jgi:hypothetical protein